MQFFFVLLTYKNGVCGETHVFQPSLSSVCILGVIGTTVRINGSALSHRFSTETASSSDTDYHTIIKDGQKVTGEGETLEFQAETRMLLDIVARSLYSEKEVINYMFIIA